MIPCYVINLDRSPERMNNIRRYFEPMTSLRLIRVPAIDLTSDSLSESEREGYLRHYHPFRFRLCIGQGATQGEIGCFLSHQKALRLFLDSDKPFAAIFEDDICPKPYLAEILEEVIASSAYWDIVRLGMNRPQLAIHFRELHHGIKLATCLKGFAFAGGYLVNRSAAEFILKELTEIDVPWDLKIFRGWKKMREASLIPGAYELDELSLQSTLGNRKKKLSLPISLFWWTCRFYRIYARIVRTCVQLQRVWERRRVVND